MKNDTSQLTVPPMQILEGVQMMFVTDEPVIGYHGSIEVHSLEDIRKYYRPGMFLYISKIRGMFLCEYVPREK